jgi:hypothetical protein
VRVLAGIVTGVLWVITEFYLLFALGFGLPSASGSRPGVLVPLIIYGVLVVVGLGAVVAGIAWGRFPESTGSFVLLTVLVVAVISIWPGG